MTDNTMKPFHPQRKSPRLQGYDYAQSGAYFVTICTRGRAHFFGEIIDGAMALSDIGAIAQDELSRISTHWPHYVELDVSVVMPNHIHAILLFVGTARLPSAGEDKHKRTDAQKGVPTLGRVIGSYKAGVTRRIHPVLPIWQSRDHDHVIRSEPDRDRIRHYVLNNPARWQADTFYSA